MLETLWSLSGRASFPIIPKVIAFACLLVSSFAFFSPSPLETLPCALATLS